MLINNVKVGYKLVGSIVLVCLMATAVILYGAKLRIDLLRHMDSVYGKYVADILEIKDIKSSLEKMRGDLYRYIDVPTDRQQMAQNINGVMSSVTDSIQAYKDRNIGAEGKKIIAEFDAAWPQMQRGYKAIMKATDEGKRDEVDRLLAAGSYAVQSQANTFASIDNLNDHIISKNEAAVKANMKASGGLSIAMVILAAISIAIIIVLVILLSISITQPLKKGVLMMDALKRGHLSNRLGIKRKDEIGVLANSMDEFADHLQQNVVFNIQQISKGNMDIEPTIIDDKDEIGPALQQMVEIIKKLIKEMNDLTHLAKGRQILYPRQ